MFGFKKNVQASAILIDGTDAIVSDRKIMTTIWQQRHTPSNIGAILSKAINTADDSVDIAIKAYIDAHGMSLPLYEPFHHIPFSRQSGISGNVWHHGAEYLVAVKGMPERILEHCDMSENERESITTQLRVLSASGAIVIAVATAVLQHSIKDMGSLKKNEKLSFVGFISLKTELSTEARQLITTARSRSMSVYMYTGQHQAATYYLAQELDIASLPGDVFDAHKLDIMSANDLRDVVASTRIFSRCSPEHKKRILSAIKVTNPAIEILSTTEDLKKLLAR